MVCINGHTIDWNDMKETVDSDGFQGPPNL